MEIQDSLRSLQPLWLQRASAHLTRAEGVRQSFSAELLGFFDALYLPDNASLDEILEPWCRRLASSRLNAQTYGIAPLLNALFTVLYDLARETFSPSDALALVTGLLPKHTYALSFASTHEKEHEISGIRSEIESNRAELERLDKSKSDFISVAAHELKTPLTLIEGYAAMLRDAVGNGLQPAQVNLLLEGMGQGARRLRRIIDDMIDVSLIDNRLLTLNFQPVWLNRMLAILTAEYQAAIAERSQTFSILPFDGYEEMFFADAERIYQAFSNLLSNAIKFTPDNGRITISGRRLPGFFDITFADSGIGIAVEDQLRIFEKFHRLGDATLHSSGHVKFKGGGPGLGLAITKGIIDAHGGAMWVESEGNDEVKYPGSIFHVLLPFRKSPPDEQIAKLFQQLIEPGTN